MTNLTENYFSALVRENAAFRTENCAGKYIITRGCEKKHYRLYIQYRQQFIVEHDSEFWWKFGIWLSQRKGVPLTTYLFVFIQNLIVIIWNNSKPIFLLFISELYIISCTLKYIYSGWFKNVFFQICVLLFKNSQILCRIWAPTKRKQKVYW